MTLRDLAAGRPIAAADLRHDGNAFTLARWILASTVMFSHGWDLTQPARGLDPSVAVFGFPVSRLAVFLFFTLSGFLVTGSLVKRGTGAFFLARGLRLLPGLWTMLVLLPLGLWLAFGTQPLAEFLGDPITRRFVWRNALLLGGEYRLPGLFTTQPVPQIANGSLWTIPEEVRCYLALGLFGMLGLIVPRWRLTLLFAAGCALHLALPLELVPALIYPRQLAFAFFIGALAYLWRDRVRLSWPLAAGLAAAALAIPATSPLGVPAIQLGFGYLALTAAFLAGGLVKRFSAAMPDYSYGIYIYAFPMQQAALALGAATPLANIALAFAMTLPAAALSWHCIESPALGAKDWLTRRRA